METILDFWGIDDSVKKKELRKKRILSYEKLPISDGEDNLTGEESATFYDGTCPDCNGNLYNGPTGGNSINIVCPQAEGGCGMVFMETGWWRPYRIGKRDN